VKSSGGALLLLFILAGAYIGYLVWRDRPQRPPPGGGRDLAPPRLAGTVTPPVRFTTLPVGVPVRVRGFTA